MNQQAPELMTLDEAASFLRLSRSTLYQRGSDIPRHRLPGSREYRFLKSELLAWLTGEQAAPAKDGTTGEPVPVLDIGRQQVYHRRKLYR
jgi:excisionase family DNA binding protein